MSERWHPAGIAVEPCEPRPEVDLVETEDEIDVGAGDEQSGGLTEQAGDVVGREAGVVEPGPAAEDETRETPTLPSPSQGEGWGGVSLVWAAELVVDGPERVERLPLTPRPLRGANIGSADVPLPAAGERSGG